MRNPISRGKFSYNLGKADVITPTAIIGPEETPAPAPTVVRATQQAPTPNRKQKRRQAVFTKHLARRLAKEKVPVKIEVLPDGGLHVTADMREEKP
jgi:hypothetical protein